VPDEATVHAIVPLALLEAIRNLDTPLDDGLAELASETVSRRLGMSSTVSAQIGRYREAAAKGAGVSLEEATQVFRLAGRRADANLVFADAGRRAARLAGRQSAQRAIGRLLPRSIRRALGHAESDAAIEERGIRVRERIGRRSLAKAQRFEERRRRRERLRGDREFEKLAEHRESLPRASVDGHCRRVAA
jgi:hypothetical protein